MQSRGTRAAVAGLIVLTAIGVTSVASAPRWRPAAGELGEARRAFVTGIFEDPSARNPWARFGPNSTTWNAYVAAGEAPALFDYTTRNDWVPALAEDLPSPLQYDPDTGLWRSTVRLRRDVVWSDGTPITAHDVAFTFTTIAAFGATKLGGNFASLVPPEVLAKVEARDDYSAEFFLHKRDARYRFGVLVAPIFQRGFWEPHIKEALASPDPLNAIFNVDVVEEPVAGAFLQGTWERGSFVDRPANRRFSGARAVEALFANGAVRLDDGKGRSWRGYGTPAGDPSLTVVTGPNVDAVHYRVFGTQAAGVLALQSGSVSILLNPLGLEKGFEDQLRNTPGITLIKNPNNGIRYLAFNTRKEPMSRLPFRQAIATLIDREFVTERVLQGVAYPMSSIVPSSNIAWYNPDLRVAGQGLSRADRIREAVCVLESAGFTWASKPQLASDGSLKQPGRGLRLPTGELVRPLELLCPTEAYDAMRYTFATWVERWLSEVGIPVHASPQAFNVIISRIDELKDLDMWILGFSLTPYPTYLDTFFHSRNTGPRGRNASGYVNPEYDKLADAFLEETDDMAHAKTLAFELQAYLNRELPWIPLFDTPLVEAYRSDQVRFPTTSALGGLQGAPRYGWISAVELAR